MCGFIGLIGTDNPVREVHDGLLAIQHRGQDAAGIVAYDGQFHLRKGAGLVRDVFSPEAMSGVRGHVALGHVRYPTVGAGKIEDAQPFVATHPYGIAMAHNGNVSNFAEVRERLRLCGRRHLLSQCDVEVILNVFADSIGRQSAGGAFTTEVFRAAVAEVFEQVHGAYSVVGFVAGEGLFAFRDPYGIKPICFGRRQEADGRTVYGFASESVVLENLGFTVEARPGPGEAVLVRENGEVVFDQVVPPKFRPCVFEFVYFARPDSEIDGMSVYRVREGMGRALAHTVRRLGITADAVVPVPESARSAALELARELGWPFREALVKNRYVGRTFIMPGDAARRTGVRNKLNVIGSEVRGRSVLLVDDSIVRGTTSRQIIDMVREAGATKVYLASTAPPLRHPCVYGIDMSTRREFVAQGRNTEEIAAALGADAVIYQELDDLVESVRREFPGQLETTCTACFSGEYPTGDVDEAALMEIEQERLGSAV